MTLRFTLVPCRDDDCECNDARSCGARPYGRWGRARYAWVCISVSLLRAGRIRRSVAAADRRRSVLRLSAAGEAVYREIAPVALRYERSLLEGLAAAEITSLDSVLGKLTARAQSLAEPARTRKK